LSASIKNAVVDVRHGLRHLRRFVMSEPDLRSRIKQMLVKNLMLQTTPEEIGDDLPLFGPNGLGLDSIDALELVVSMEKTFGVGVPNSEVAGKALRTVNTLHDYIVEKGSAAPPAASQA
jgi:acyl carrier protein